MAEFPAELPAEFDDPAQQVTFRLYLSTADTLDTTQPEDWGPGHADWDTVGGFLNVDGSWVNVAHIVQVFPL